VLLLTTRYEDEVKMRVEEEYADVLQNIETAIVAVFGKNLKIVDRDVLAAVDALIKVYTREKSGHRVQSPGPPGRAGTVYQHCHRICEWRLGKQPLNEGEPLKDDPRLGELSVSEIILCLKRIRKSIRLWHAQAGPQGYLKYVCQFLAC
jgi:hypothetical protein